MANNLIQIKRTAVSGRAANTTTLPNPGELALNMSDGILYSGNGSVVFEIGANTTNSRVTGNLSVLTSLSSNNLTITATTASTNTTTGALIVAGGVGIDGATRVRSLTVSGNTNLNGNVILQVGRALYANDSPGSAGQVLSSNGTAAYWSTSIGYAGSAGFTGSIGSTGFTGSVGYTGSKGDTGFTGSKGDLGYTGSIGPSAGSNNQILYKNSSNTLTGSDGLKYDGVSLKVNGNLESVYSNGDEGGEIYLQKPVTNSTLAAGVTIDVYQNKLRIFENAGTNRGAYIDLTAASTGVGSNLLAASTAGFTGSKGDLGYTGSIGYTGSQGTSGFTGSQGTTGFTGSVGTTGFTGSTGYVGSFGYTGSKGDLGYTGSKGDIGYTGSTGYVGSKGDLGYTGSQGPAGTFGGAAFNYNFSTNTTHTSTPDGYLNFSNTNLSQANALYIDYIDALGSNSFSFLQTIDDSTSAIKGHFSIKEAANSLNYAMFAITGYHTQETDHFNVPISYLSGTTSFTNGTNTVITFARTGDIGDTGYTGSTGSTGYVGSFGYTGSKGDIGYTGSIGNTGYTGSQGIQGTTGYTGSQGNLGYTGSVGTTGFTGSLGYTGSKGDIGYSGSQGISTDINLNSYTFTGNGSNTQFTLSNYVTENTVIVSVNGLVQTPDSAYNITGSNNVIVFTEAPGANSSIEVKVVSGGIGYTGSQGPAGGYTGSQGTTGFVGSTGSLGYTGSIGFTGSQGTTGYAGSLGYSGSIGYTGSQGNLGYSGSIGYTGSVGYTGSLGYTGSKGDLGYTGSVGFTGSAGSQGATGYTGSLGYTGSQGVGYTGSQGNIGYTGSTATGNTTITSNSELFTANGSTNTFTLSTSTYSNSTVLVTLNGLLLTPSDHYGITGSTLSFVVTPANNDYIEVRQLTGYGAIGYTGSAGTGGGGSAALDDIISLNLMFGLL